MLPAKLPLNIFLIKGEVNYTKEGFILKNKYLEY
jgi:hypothetical protein